MHWRAGHLSVHTSFKPAWRSVHNTRPLPARLQLARPGLLEGPDSDFEQHAQHPCNMAGGQTCAPFRSIQLNSHSMHGLVPFVLGLRKRPIAAVSPQQGHSVPPLTTETSLIWAAFIHTRAPTVLRASRLHLRPTGLGAGAQLRLQAQPDHPVPKRPCSACEFPRNISLYLYITTKSAGEQREKIEGGGKRQSSLGHQTRPSKKPIPIVLSDHFLQVKLQLQAAAAGGCAECACEDA